MSGHNLGRAHEMGKTVGLLPLKNRDRRTAVSASGYSISRNAVDRSRGAQIDANNREPRP